MKTSRETVKETVCEIDNSRKRTRCMQKKGTGAMPYILGKAWLATIVSPIQIHSLSPPKKKELLFLDLTHALKTKMEIAYGCIG